MKRLALTIGFCILLGTIAGCGSKADRLVKEQIGLLNELAGAYDSGAPQSRIDEIKQALDENDKMIEDLKLSDDAKRRIKREYDAELRQALKRITDARRRAGLNDDGSAPSKQ
jgi:hypothetical protein